MSWVNKIVLAYIIVFLNSLCFAEESYYLTLRNDKVNLRQGPSFDYPVKIVYEKKFLPILVLDKSDNWRKILDHENNSGWIHWSQLSKKKAAFNILDNSIFSEVLFLIFIIFQLLIIFIEIFINILNTL